jgi:predicted RNA-binding protein
MKGGERYWVGVASRDHLLRGVQGGFAQLSHGKRAPLQRMRTGDWLVYYSPRESRNGGELLQAFTALGRVVGEEVYQFDMGGGFVPFRRDVAYLLTKEEAPIRPLIDRLSFIRNKERWGQAFRSGHFEIHRADFELIASAMGLSLGMESEDRPED